MTQKQSSGIELISTGDLKGETQAKTAGGGAVSEEADPKGCSRGKLLRPQRRGSAMDPARRKFGVSERYAFQLLLQWRATKRFLPMLYGLLLHVKSIYNPDSKPMAAARTQ
jgi:hypothetical protein